MTNHELYSCWTTLLDHKVKHTAALAEKILVARKVPIPSKTIHTFTPETSLRLFERAHAVWMNTSQFDAEHLTNEWLKDIAKVVFCLYRYPITRKPISLDTH